MTEMLPMDEFDKEVEALINEDSGLITEGARPKLREKPTLVRPNRLTIVDRIYHQQEGQEPISVESKFLRRLENDEQAYHRRLKVGMVSIPLIDEKCWVDWIGIIRVENEEGRFLNVKPTEEQKEDAAKKVLRIFDESWDGGYLKVLPGESQRLDYSEPSKLRIRSEHDTCRFNIVVYPE